MYSVNSQAVAVFNRHFLHGAVYHERDGFHRRCGCSAIFQPRTMDSANDCSDMGWSSHLVKSRTMATGSCAE